MKKEKYHYSPIESIFEPLEIFIEEENKEVVRNALLLAFISGRVQAEREAIEMFNKKVK